MNKKISAAKPRPAIERLETRQLLSTVGTPDSGWGVGGTTVTPLPGHTLGTPSAILPQGDNGVIVVGTTAPEGSPAITSVFLAKFNSDGSLQQHWGTSGFVFTTPNYTSLIFMGAGESQNGAITVLVSVDKTIARHKKFYSTGGAMLVQYNADGTLDRHFGHGGEMLLSGLTSNQDAVSVASDGTITVAGVYTGGPTRRLISPTFDLPIANQPPAPSQFEVLRFTPAGRLDHAFGNGGIARKKAGIAVGLTSMVVDGAGDIAIAGSVYFGQPITFFNTPFDSAIVRFDATGRPDSLFGSNGIIIGAQNIYVPQIAFGSADDLLVADVKSGVIEVADYGPTGQLNLTFGDRGIADISSADPNVAIDDITAISFKSNLDVTVLCGSAILSTGGADNSATLLQFNAVDGSVNPDFGATGQTVVPRPSDTELFATALGEGANDLFITEGVAGAGGATNLGVLAFHNDVPPGNIAFLPGRVFAAGG